jgi:agmatine deiminase
LARTIGATHVIWLPEGLTRDSQRFGTRGHVDIVAAITAPGRLVLHSQRDESHPDFSVCQRIRAAIEASADAAGRSWEITEIPAPATLTDSEGFVDYSYINHLIVNGGIIACGFGDANDADAVAILAEQYPGRKVVTVDARPLFARGGGIHCITQQQPLPRG